MIKPRKHLHVVEREPEHREGDWEIQRARRARDYGRPPPRVSASAPPLVRERLIERRSLQSLVNGAFVDRPSAEWLRWRVWGMWIGGVMAGLFLISLIGAIIRALR